MINEVDLIVKKAVKLSAEETLTLVQKLMADLRRKLAVKKTSNGETQTGLVYGEFKNSGGRMSTEEDFKLAEYHFNEEDWK